MKDKDILKIVDQELSTLCRLLNVDCVKESRIEKGNNDEKYINSV
jgi:hypothetical protein